MTVSVTDTVDKLLTVEDLMGALRISRPTLYRLLKSGQLIPVRIGKRTLFDPADIRSFIEASKNVSPRTKETARKGRGKKAESQEPASNDLPKKPRTTAKLTAETLEGGAAEPPDDSGGQGRLL
jgi:excisionase family DNA binding protein